MRQIGILGMGKGCSRFDFHPASPGACSGPCWESHESRGTRCCSSLSICLQAQPRGTWHLLPVIAAPLLSHPCRNLGTFSKPAVGNDLDHKKSPLNKGTFVLVQVLTLMWEQTAPVALRSQHGSCQRSCTTPGQNQPAGLKPGVLTNLLVQLGSGHIIPRTTNPWGKPRSQPAPAPAAC